MKVLAKLTLKIVVFESNNTSLRGGIGNATDVSDIDELRGVTIVFDDMKDSTQETNDPIFTKDAMNSTKKFIPLIPILIYKKKQLERRVLHTICSGNFKKNGSYTERYCKV